MSIHSSIRVVARGPVAVASRGFATEKQIALRIVATSNLKKITASMKMVSAAKMRGDANRLTHAKPFGQWVDALGAKNQAIEFIDTSEYPKTNLFVAFSTDKGLCGGVNSFISRGMRKIRGLMAEDGKDLKLITVGEKGRGQMRRILENEMLVSMTDSVYPGTFNTVCGQANEVLAVDPSEYEKLHIVYNEFVSAIAYTPTVKTLPSLAGEGINEPLVDYEFEQDSKNEVLEDLREYLVGTSMFYAAMENAASEQSARTSAMENASKNAGELIDDLTLQYNKARQSRITTELIEIISGASAIEKKD
jgi:F-type H+-transporting ATPase subunit gamma